MIAALTTLIGLVLFSALHSWLAGERTHAFVRAHFGERVDQGLYRLGYNVVATLTLAPVLVSVVLFPGPRIWQVESAPVVMLLYGIQLVGLIGLIISLLQIDLGRFTGLSQLAAYLNHDPLPLPPEPLQIHGVYRLVRHPLYLFSLLVIWPQPDMSAALLAFNSAATAYFVIGSRLEEERMLAAFGEPYRSYQQRVPWLIPLLPPRRSHKNPG